MPGFDCTGPNGSGPMTGGGRGYCSGNPMGMGRGARGMGRGHGFRFASQPAGASMNEAEFLKNEAAALKRRLADIDARITQISPDS